MASHQKDNKSLLKLAQIYNSFQKNLDKELSTERVVENILKKKKGYINYKIPSSRCVTDPKLIGCTALHFAAKNNDTEVVRILLNNGADVTIKNGEGRTALHYAVNQESPKKELIDIILSKHLSLAVTNNPCDTNGLSHFHIACLYDHMDYVKFFLNSSGILVDMAVNSDAKRFAGYTPLHFAAEGIAVAVIRIFFKNNPEMDVKVKDARGLTPLQILLQKRTKFLDSRIALSANETYTEIEKAIRLLLNSNGIDDIGFHIACTLQNKSAAERFLEKNVVNWNHLTFNDGETKLADFIKLARTTHNNKKFLNLLPS